METFERTLSRWCAAEAGRDAAALDALLDADFRGDHPQGRVLGKEQWLARDGSGTWSPTELRVNKHTAVAMGVHGAYRFTLVAVRREDRWTIVNVQIGAAIEPPQGRQITHLADVPIVPLHQPVGMTKLIADMAMSLDGFIADTNDSTDHLFGWFFNGDVEVPTATPGVVFRTSESSASMLRDAFETVGALISGRRNFDIAQGWGGTHPMGVPVFVVTHDIPDGWPREDSSIVFVTDGLESAVAQAKEAAGDKIVGVATPSLVQQCLDAGILDGIHVNLVPVLLGEGVPFFAGIASAPVELEGPEIVEGEGVTHLNYRVKR